MNGVKVDDYYNERNAASESPSGIVPVGANVNWHGPAVLLECHADSASGGYQVAEAQGAEAFRADGHKAPKANQVADRNVAEATDVMPDMFDDVETYFISNPTPYIQED